MDVRGVALNLHGELAGNFKPADPATTINGLITDSLRSAGSDGSAGGVRPRSSRLCGLPGLL